MLSSRIISSKLFPRFLFVIARILSLSRSILCAQSQDAFAIDAISKKFPSIYWEPLRFSQVDFKSQPVYLEIL